MVFMSVSQNNTNDVIKPVVEVVEIRKDQINTWLMFLSRYLSFFTVPISVQNTQRLFHEQI